MTKITYIEWNGTAHDVEAPDGENLMEAALNNSIPGIDGDCGGNAACATCHVYVDPAWQAVTGTVGELESEMLDLADGREANSRLACQITARPELAGLILRMPETQH